MQELIKINEQFNEDLEQLEQVVSAREVHKMLGIEKRFSAWLENAVNIVGQEGVPVGTPSKYIVIQESNGAQQEVDDFLISVDTAKLICMVSKGANANKIRDYFVQVEKAWNDPMQVMNRALLIAKHQVEKRDLQLEAQRQQVEFARTVSETNGSISLREFSALLNIPNLGQNKLFEWLRDNHYLMDGNLPYREYIERGYFKVIEQTYNRGESTFIYNKVLISGKGQVYLTNKIKNSLESNEERSA